MKFLRVLVDEIMDVFFPGSCPVCSSPPKMDEGYYACLECLDEVAWVGGSTCKYCGIPMHSVEYQGLVCSNCRKHSYSFNRGKCMFILDDVGKGVIHAIKYQGARDVLNDMPHWLDRCAGYRDFLKGAHLVPVPLHRRRGSKRGFNQSLWIAHAIKKDLGSVVEVGDFMKRTRNTPTQTRLEKKERKQNVKNAFALKDKNSLNFEDRIVLVDDVYTTGATLDACAKVLIDHGFQNVYVATLGHG